MVQHHKSKRTTAKLLNLKLLYLNHPGANQKDQYHQMLEELAIAGSCQHY